MVNGPRRIKGRSLGGLGFPLIFRPNWGRALRAEKNFFETGPPPLISGSGWLGAPPPPHLSEGVDPPLYNNIATILTCASKAFACVVVLVEGNCEYCEFQNLRLALCFFSGWNRISIIRQLSARMAFCGFILVYLAFFCCLEFLFLLVFFFVCVNALCSCVWCAVPDL